MDIISQHFPTATNHPPNPSLLAGARWAGVSGRGAMPGRRGVCPWGKEGGGIDGL